jgi:hypothetical protein
VQAYPSCTAMFRLRSVELANGPNRRCRVRVRARGGWTQHTRTDGWWRPRAWRASRAGRHGGRRGARADVVVDSAGDNTLYSPVPYTPCPRTASPYGTPCRGAGPGHWATAGHTDLCALGHYGSTVIPPHATATPHVHVHVHVHVHAGRHRTYPYDLRCHSDMPMLTLHSPM